MLEDNINDAINKARVLGYFKKFADHLSNDPANAHKTFNILEQSRNKYKTIRQIFKNQFDIELAEGDEEYLLELITAFFHKRSYRNQIPIDVKQKLLASQNDRCAYCGCEVNEHDPVDHIIPFKYVGDELENNYQIICSACNSKKNASMDYQIRYLFNLV